MSSLAVSPVRFRRIPFMALVLLHLIAVSAIWSGVSARTLLLCLGLYLIQMFGVTAGYHRYFAHRSFETGRVMRFGLAWLALTSLQRPVLWWAAKHRDHHRFSDGPGDMHSPVVHGWFRSHLTWVFYTDCDEPTARVQDLRQFPEIVSLDRAWRLPFLVLAIGVTALFGWQGLVVGLVWSTLLVYHATGAINSLAHIFGWRRYATTDDSRNNWWLALLTMGEGWHNNHHHYQSSARQGFFWWEIDPTYQILLGLQRLGLVWNVREPPDAVRGDPSARA